MTRRQPRRTRSVAVLVSVALLIGACSGSGDDEPVAPEPTVTAVAEPTATEVNRAEPEEAADAGPGGFSFDRSDPEGGVANIMEAFATNSETATCIFEAWGDVATIAPEELTPELMTFEICGTSIFQMITGDPRFTGGDG